MDWSTLVSQLGFPIVCVGAMAWYIWTMTNNYRKDIKDSNQQHRDCENTLAEAINNNTLVMRTLCERIGVDVEVPNAVDLDGDKKNE